MFAGAFLGLSAYFLPLALVRAAVSVVRAALRHDARRVFRFSPSIVAWIWDSGWLLSAHAMLAMTYTWCKLYLPAYGGRLCDSRLAAVDLVLHLGVNPNVFLLTLVAEGPRWMAAAVDAEYAAFATSMLVTTAWFLSDGRRPARLTFATANALLWMAGLVGYVAMPALGPAMAIDGLKAEIASSFPIAAAAQRALHYNYVNVLQMLANPGKDYLVTPSLGVAAMPSMHVAAHAFLFLWAVILGSTLRTPLLLMAMMTFIGSIATGWHYAVDSWAGILIACAAALLARLLLGGRQPREGENRGQEAREGEVRRDLS
jgi:hypothetical protein